MSASSKTKPFLAMSVSAVAMRKVQLDKNVSVQARCVKNNYHTQYSCRAGVIPPEHCVCFKNIKAANSGEQFDFVRLLTG